MLNEAEYINIERAVEICILMSLGGLCGGKSMYCSHLAIGQAQAADGVTADSSSGTSAPNRDIPRGPPSETLLGDNHRSTTRPVNLTDRWAPSWYGSLLLALRTLRNYRIAMRRLRLSSNASLFRYLNVSYLSH